jgi:hypothetical protein
VSGQDWINLLFSVISGALAGTITARVTVQRINTRSAINSSRDINQSAGRGSSGNRFVAGDDHSRN